MFTVVALLMGLAATPPTDAAGSITGRVLDARSEQPLPSVQVYVEGTRIGALTDRNGRYTLENVPDGEVTVIAQLIGYGTARERVVVTSGGRAVQDFRLAERAINLDEIVVTGTVGGAQRRAIGNAVEKIDVSRVRELAPAITVDQMIGQRTAGLMVMPSAGQVGTGSPLQIRGVNSLSLTTDPIVFIDGIRMDNDPRRGTGQRGGARVSRLNDLNLNDIESIEVIKGPAAATLYGTEASNGVIQIITKRGASGKPTFEVDVRTGTNWMWNPEERAGLRWARNAQTGEITSFNVYEHERVNGKGPVFGYGTLQGYAANLRGGNDAVRYYVSGSWNNDVGIVDYNWDKRLALRGNLDVVLSERVTLRTSNSFTQARTRLIQGGINQDPFSNLMWATPATMSQRQRGWFVAPPEEWGKVEDRADNDRTTSTFELNYRPFAKSTHRVVVGLDRSEEKSWQLVPRMPEGSSHFFGAAALGTKTSTRDSRQFVTLDYSGNINYEFRGLDLTSSAGLQYYRSSNAAVSATGTQFPAPPITTVTGGAVRSGTETLVENSTVGVFVQQQAGWRNRVFVTGAIRGDDNSAFGAEYDAAIYPKLSAAWVVHEEPFFQVPWVEQLRLRAAWGTAGQQPGTFDAARLYDPSIGFRDQPALLPGEYGNPQLKPERGEELEAGIDATFWDGRIDLTYTHYNRNTEDAIVNRPLPPSSGFAGSQVVNIGRVKGWGHELGLVTRVLQGAKVGLGLETQFATMRNRIESLGGLAFIGAGGQAQHREGYGISDLFMYRVLSARIDANGNLLESMCDGGQGPLRLDPGGPPVPCAQAGKVWWGHTQPTWQIGVGSTLTLFNRLRLYARAEGSGDFYQVNTEIRAIHNLVNSEAMVKRNDPILLAYRAVENDATGAYKAGFLRLREVSAAYDLPGMVLDRIGATRATLTVGMRNVAMLWTEANGWSTSRDGSIRVPIANMIAWDPEIRGSGVRSNNFQTIMPPTASLTASLRVTF